jgi:hypothetical protein
LFVCPSTKMFATTRAGGAVLPGTVSAVMYPASNCVRAARPVRLPTGTRLPCVPGSSTELRCFNARSPSLPRQPRGCSLRAVPIESVVDLTAAGLDGLLAHLPHHLPNHLTLLYERVTLPCSSQNCGDMVYRRSATPLNRPPPFSLITSLPLSTPSAERVWTTPLAAFLNTPHLELTTLPVHLISSSSASFVESVSRRLYSFHFSAQFTETICVSAPTDVIALFLSPPIPLNTP